MVRSRPMTRILIGLLTLLASTPTSATTCLMVVDGRTYIDGPCHFYPDKEGGDGFMVEGLTPMRPGRSVPWQAEVSEDGGYWNNDDGVPALHHDTLGGSMRREGACFVNARARVCAWK